jgi:hypothetical protein
MSALGHFRPVWLFLPAGLCLLQPESRPEPAFRNGGRPYRYRKRDRIPGVRILRKRITMRRQCLEMLSQSGPGVLYRFLVGSTPGVTAR